MEDSHATKGQQPQLQNYPQYQHHSLQSSTKDKLGASSYSININLSNETIQNLKTYGYRLYAFKSVLGNAGKPVVWIKYDTFLNNHVINWTEQYQGYVGTETVVNNTTTINASTQLPVDLGSKWTVDKNGVSAVTTNGTSGAVTFVSSYNQTLQCGLSYKDPVTGQMNPVCAFPLFGSGMFDVITPIAKVALLFASDKVNTGAVIEQSFSPGLLIDLTNNNSQTVSYDIQTGWKTPLTSDFTLINQDQSLIDLLNGGNSSLRSYNKANVMPGADMSVAFSLRKGVSEAKAEYSSRQQSANLSLIMNQLVTNLKMLSNAVESNSSVKAVQ